ncbi:hypothetical protein CK203_093950 [Vitis vinifera]|uniref:Uncharacterized protein n=1 Tax=Vitis vinifera TaxID=29760 RepID=A0A438CKA4_VITVI|nr:hypothetical protein CK203_093950 [Vitis vinifera]
MLRPCVPGDQRSCQMDGHTISTNIDSWFSRSCKGVRIGCPDTPSDGFVSHGLERIINWEIFWFVMMPLGGGRAIITLRAADRNRERRRGCQRSWEVTCHHFIPVLSLCRWRNYRVPLPEEVQIGEACHVSSWGNPDGGNPDRNVSHVSSGNVCHASSGGGVPTMDTPMDYDDNDFQSQNLRLAGEGSAKFPPVLGPYALPKFDFDDSLQGHLRRNNVWSEATSSESVEMLLKSVGQEEIVPGQTTVKDSGACDELGSITKQMEHNLKPDNSNLSNVGNVIDSGPTIRPDEFLGSFSVLNKDAGKELPQIEDTSQTREGDSLAYRSSTDLPVTEGNMLIDSKDDDANQGKLILCTLSIWTPEESRGEGNAVETCTSNVEGPSSTIVKSDSELNVVEGCSEGVKESVQESKCEVVLSKDTEMVDQFTVNMHGGSPIASKGESSFSGHAVEVSNRNAENCAILEQKMDSHVQLTYEKSSFVKKKDDLLESGNQLNSEISTSHLDTSLLSEETNKLSEGNCDGSGSHHEGDISSKLVVSSSAELCGESHTTENVKCANVAFGVHGEDLNAGDHVPISTPSESIQIRIQNAVSRQSEPYVVLKDTDLVSHETLDGSSLPSGLGVSTVDSFVHKEDGKPPFTNSGAYSLG